MRNMFAAQNPFTMDGWVRTGWGLPTYQGDEAGARRGVVYLGGVAENGEASVGCS